MLFHHSHLLCVFTCYYTTWGENMPPFSDQNPLFWTFFHRAGRAYPSFPSGRRPPYTRRYWAGVMW